jgi:nitroreductase
MYRSFTHRKISNPLIERLLYAANRAPAAGNVRTSEIIIIKDEFTIQEIKKVSPGFDGICPLLIAICTDKTSTQETELASFDAGAIAENIALAATDLGLGVCFLKSYPDKIVHTILKISSAKAKIEILVCVGYPAKDHARATVQSIPIRTYDESYFNVASSKEVSQLASDSPRADASNANDLKKDEEEDGGQGSAGSLVFDLALFILTSARSTIDESSRYGPKRLVDSLIRLLDIPRASFVQRVESGEEVFLDSIRAELEKRTDLRSSSMVYTKEFKDFLDDLIDRFVVHMEKQRKE